MLAQAHAHAQAAGKSGAKTYRFFTPQQAAEFDAFSAQIIPTDDTPGAREANVVHFTDYVLSTIDSDQQAQVKDALKALQEQVGEDGSGSDLVRGAHFRAADRGHESDGEDGGLRRSPRLHADRLLLRSVAWAATKTRWAGSSSASKIDFLYKPPFGYYDAHYDEGKA